MSESVHLGDTLHDLLDGRLEADVRARAESHLAECASCQRELDALRWVKGVAAREAGRHEVPAQLASAISSALDREERPERTVAPAWRRNLRPLIAFGLLLTVAAALLFWLRPGGASLPIEVARDYSRYRAGALPLAHHTTNGGDLEKFFAASGIGFETRVFDLAMMGYRVAGGRVHSVAGHPSALFVYQGDDGKLILCQMFAGRLADLPPPAAVREHDGIQFHVHRQEGLTIVFWQEGDVLCVLASQIPAEEVIQLAFAKAVKVARSGFRLLPQG
jgi:anti-sigma factor RsiW